MSPAENEPRAWTDALSNPQAITSLYASTPQIVELFSILVLRDGPAIEIAGLLDRFPDNPPSKWVAAQSNQAVVTLRFDGCSDVHIQGWSPTNRGTLEIETTAPRSIRFAFTSDSMSILEGTAMFADIKWLSHYSEPPGP
jgi:Immunity protein 50